MLVANKNDVVDYLELYRDSLIPLYACLVGLTWIIHDYFITLEDEINYIWRSERAKSKFLFLWIRYYSLALVVFDVTQIHLFSRPGITSDVACVAMDPITRGAGAISLWSIEIIMQLRIYALCHYSQKVVFLNAFLFACSIAGFILILVHNTSLHHTIIEDAILLPLPGCPTLHVELEWLQWVPATAFEGLLFGFALFKMLGSTMSTEMEGKIPLTKLVLRDNILYFIVIHMLLICNSLMVMGATYIPWFSHSPFHAAMGILTSRILLNIHKNVATDIDISLVVGRLADGEGV